MSSTDQQPAFEELGLPESLLKAVQQIGYETPSPIQAECIPLLLSGDDLVGQAQTGTGKTAAFALPLLSRIDVKSPVTQMLVLAPTRELAIQVAEACQSFAKYLKDFHVLPIYGGQAYSTQLRQLKRGVQVVVGTPGRVMDHMRRGTLKLNSLKALVLDEADEMLRMGFIDDVEWVLEHVPKQCQIALFSATMPSQIRKVADSHLKSPKHIKIASKSSTAKTITQRFLHINHAQKLDAMTRILETEEFDGVITFVRTKHATADLADKLSARGYAAEALSGDVPQDRREKIVAQLKRGNLDILVATDVAARGLDVDRISHVINYDIPNDTESYVHRIGRTGRAGREGQAILFVTPRESRLLKAIERATNQSITKMTLPSVDDIYATRVARFKQKISETLASEELGEYQQLIADFRQEQEVEGINIAAALAYLLEDSLPVLKKDLRDIRESRQAKTRDGERDNRSERGGRPDRKRRGNDEAPRHRGEKKLEFNAKPLKDFPDIVMRRYRIEVGHDHKVKPGNIVGAIANEADIESRYIGAIEIFDTFSTVDLPDGMPMETFEALQKTWVCQQKLNIKALTQEQATSGKGKKSATKKSPTKKSAKKKPSGKRSGRTNGDVADKPVKRKKSKKKPASKPQ